MNNILFVRSKTPGPAPKILVILAILFATPTFAQISPGKLSEAHAELEGITNCTHCHVLGQDVAAEKCFDCHSALQARVNTAEGYHSSAEVQQQHCSQCHSEHHGREFELIHWEDGRDAFNHNLAGWELTGAHGDLECGSCHQPRFQDSEAFSGDETIDPSSTFLGLDQACTQCHQDEHGDQLDDTCLDCHTQRSWTPAPGFDHREDADYALTGRHLDVACDKCHAPREYAVENSDLIVYEGSPGTQAHYDGLAYTSCADCHEDPHNGRFGADCARCHTTDGFRDSQVGDEFDHSKTDFPLQGLHRTVDCQTCHTSGSMTRALPHDRCMDCHTDEHRGQFADRQDGGACDACHSVQRPFKRHSYTVADHEQADYPLTGSHQAIPCALCHVQVPAGEETDDSYGRFEFESTRCQACHDDIHRGQLDIWVEKNGCEFCHNTDTWHRTSFDHSLARFPLEGKHREILCLRCHTIQTDEGEQRVWMKPLEMTCAGCHEDPHAGQFAAAPGEKRSCDRCHEPVGWKQLEFDHGRDTEFPLTGGHSDVPCARCHGAVERQGEMIIQWRGVDRACAACHS